MTRLRHVPEASNLVVDGATDDAGIETLSISPGDASQDSADHTIAHNKVICVAAATSLYFPIKLPLGAKITGWRVELQKNTDAGEELNFDIVESYRGVDSVIDAAHLSTSNAENAPGNWIEGVPAGSGSCEIQLGRSYFLRCEFNPGSITPAADRFHAVDIFWRKLRHAQ